MTYRPYPSATRARHQLDRSGADLDPVDTHDWHHATPDAGLTCRRPGCGLAHKFWSGEGCPAAVSGPGSSR